MELAQSQKSNHLKPPKVMASAKATSQVTKSHGICQSQKSSHEKPPKVMAFAKATQSCLKWKYTLTPVLVPLV